MVKSYLSERTFAVRVGEVTSSTQTIGAGVPQGSVLGPHLFNIFINDIIDAALEDSRLMRLEPPDSVESLGTALYADDITLWKAAKDVEIIQERLQRALDDVHEWICRWRLRVNTKKTVYTIIENSAKKSKLNVSYASVPPEHEASPRFLGVNLDRRLNLNTQVNNIVAACKNHLNLLRRLAGKSWGLSTRLLIHTYQSLIRSRVDYFPFVSLQVSPRIANKLQIIQNKAYRISTRWPPGQTYASMYAKYKAEPVAARHKRLAEKFIERATRGSETVRDLIEHYTVHQATSTAFGQSMRKSASPSSAKSLQMPSHDTRPIQFYFIMYFRYG